MNVMDKEIENFNKILHDSQILRKIHEGSAIIKHAISEGLDDKAQEKWSLFVPTHFVYCFFAYNSLYNIDWFKSLESGYLWRIDTRKYSELERQNCFLKFCFEDEKFVSFYSDFFIGYVQRINKGIDIKRELQRIEIDKCWRGSIRNNEQIKDFQKACEDVLINKHFTKDNVSTMLDFVYNIRCNVFHGGKTLTDMKDEKQDIRLNIYASVLVAINQMVFSYFDYLNGKDLDKQYFDHITLILTAGVK